MQIYLVGGAVRDQLLGLDVKDRDWVVVGATAEDMLAQGYQQVGRQFPVFLDPQSKEEHALARTETKIGPGYSGFEVHAAPDVTLEQDLLRRDLTINAMAQDRQGQLIDEHAGQADLSAGVLRHISPAFREDPLRILRVARFAARFCQPLLARDFEVARETAQLLCKMVEANEVEALSKERAWQEFERAMGETQPRRFLEVMYQCGALQRLWAPAVQSDDWSELWPRLREVADIVPALSASPEVRFAAIIGVLPAPQAKLLSEQMGAPKRFKQLAELVATHANTVKHSTRQPPPAVLNLLNKMDAFRKPERLDDALLACEAAIRSLPKERQRPQPQREYLLSCYYAASAVTAADMMKLRLEGKALAEEIDTHRKAAIFKVKRTYRWSHFNPQI
ncbi:tRNA nucleotidyltransferase [gamma proteobacterium HTCC5015]|nr:tRNA nucleotidyltransferase [gamma proteobacterium HTCC5015]